MPGKWTSIGCCSRRPARHVPDGRNRAGHGDPWRAGKMEGLIPLVLNALTLISILMLVGLGLAIIFGLMNVINLAHGEFVTIGAYTLALVQSLNGSWWLGLALAPFVGAA